MVELEEKSPNTQAKKAPNNKKRSKALWWFTLALALAGLVWLCLWFFYFRYHESTDDAYASGNMVNVNSAISGSVIAYFADDTDRVEEGQVLILLDPTDYQVAFERELATLASVVLQVRQLYDNVEANQANVKARRVAFARAKYDYENRKQLIGSEAISNEEFIHSRDDFTSAEMVLKQAESELAAALDAAGNTVLEKHPLIEQQKGNVRTAFYRLQHTTIFAPATGYVAQRAVEVGQWVTPTTNLMAIIPEDYVWVDANFKETQLKNMRVGQPATVWFDLYGSKIKHEGKVLGIASGSGSVFSLIPPQNATGNWIKIVQRLPVRISLDPKIVEKYPIRLGISAEVSVDITDQDLPMLANVPPIRPIATTDVFDIHLDKVDKMIDDVIRKNLKQDS